MGLQSRRGFNRFFPFINIFAAIFLTLLIIYKVDESASHRKTIVGHNLEPTPWHLFPLKNFSGLSNRKLAQEIMKCSPHLSCPHNLASSTTKLKWDLNSSQSAVQCPEFFKWIHYDLLPWKETKITKDHLKAAKAFASFRVVIVEGKLYVDLYYDCVQSRVMFTIWGLIQLLRRFPGMVPDVDLMFDCMDRPTIKREEHSSFPLPLFRYCTTSKHFDIPFPDWSFWGWPEINVRPWEVEFPDIKRGSAEVSWGRRLPYAYWKGNPDVSSPIRTALLDCNDTEKWEAQILRQNWTQEVESGFEKSKLSKQCKHQYKIYAEGYAWSVSLKYILSCGSTVLLITPQYEDFLSRGLIPQQNYWPVAASDLCPSLKFAVDWGKEHPSQAETIGRNAQDFMESLSMDRVYDYMLHLITEYSKLQDFKPVPPSSAQLICQKSLLCFADLKQKELLEMSASGTALTPPCTLQNAIGVNFDELIHQNKKSIQDVEDMKARKVIKELEAMNVLKPVQNLTGITVTIQNTVDTNVQNTTHDVEGDTSTRANNLGDMNATGDVKDLDVQKPFPDIGDTN